MKYQPFILLFGFFAIGVLIAEFIPLPFRLCLCLCLFFYCFAFIIHKNKNSSILFGLLICFGTAFLACFLLSYNTFQKTNIPKVYYQQNKIWKVKVIKQERSSAKFNKYQVQVYKKSSSIDPTFNNLLYLRKGQPILHTDDIGFIQTEWQIPPPNHKPSGFDYPKFLLRKNIHLQAFVDSIYSLNHETSLAHSASRFKINTKQKLKDLGFSYTSSVFIQALALGDRLELSREKQQIMANAGIMHLFAISGLHVGIVLALFYFLSNWLRYLRYGRNAQHVLAILFIWSFAWFVDFTPSVLRACIMITIIIILILFKKPRNLIHSLFLTALLILIYKPNQLFDVGFQMSFSAVFFIAWLGIPAINKLPFRNRWLRWFESMVIIMLSAQLGVMPIILFYFNQFSGAFFIPNLVLLPIAGVLIGLSFFIVLALPIIELFPISVSVINLVFDWLFIFIEWFGTLDFLLLKRVYLNIFQFAFLFLFLVALRILYDKKYKNLLWVLPALIVFFQFSYLIDTYNKTNLERLVIFEDKVNPVFAYHHSNQVKVFSEEPLKESFIKYTLEPYALEYRISEMDYYAFKDTTQFYSIEVNPTFIYHPNMNIALNNDSKTIDINWVHSYNYYEREKATQQIFVGGFSNLNSSDSIGLLWNLNKEGAFIIDLKNYLLHDSL